MGTSARAVVLLGCLAAGARGDIMHWYWAVEVNGEAVDATRPVAVRGGDDVEIELWADFDPYLAGFAAAQFSISGGDAFFAGGHVSTDQLDGFGLNPYLSDLGDNGSFVDADLNGTWDTIDEIFAFQLARGWDVDFDSSDPILVYRVGWQVISTPSARIEIIHGPTLDGDFHNAVYEDDFGFYREYPSVSEALWIVPSPSPLATLALFAGLAIRAGSGRRRVTAGQGGCNECSSDRSY